MSSSQSRSGADRTRGSHEHQQMLATIVLPCLLVSPQESARMWLPLCLLHPLLRLGETRCQLCPLLSLLRAFLLWLVSITLWQGLSHAFLHSNLDSCRPKSGPLRFVPQVPSAHHPLAQSRSLGSACCWQAGCSGAHEDHFRVSMSSLTVECLFPDGDEHQNSILQWYTSW